MTMDDFLEIGEITSRSLRFKRKWVAAISICMQQLETHDTPYVALSGGKDSGVLAYVVDDAARRVGRDFRLWSHVSDASFPGTEETIRQIAQNLGRPVDFYRSDQSAFALVAETKKKRNFGKSGVFYGSVREYAQDKDLCFVGVRAAESKRRMKAAEIHGWTFHSNSMGDVDTCYPLLWFRLEDIAAATVMYDIPLHPIYSKQPVDLGKNANKEDRFIRLGYITSRDLLDKGTAVFLKMNYPDIFAKLQKRFPEIRNSV